VLILGTNHRSVTFAQKLESNPDLGYRILGFIDEAWSGTPEFLRTGYQLCGSNYSDLETYLRGNVVDEVAIYLPLRSQYEQALRVATLCEQQGITVRFDSDIFGLRLARPRSEWPEDAQQTTIYTGKNHDGWQFMLKRVLDFTLSLAMLALLLPFLILVGAIIKLTSDGPVFFLQERVGRNKRRFLIYKFRTMVPNAEQLLSELEHLNETDGAAFKVTSDPRVTRVGKYLRRTSIDELPQLINVLKGEMSLVGPRPLPIRDYENFNQDWQRRRFSVRPGITCLWQTCGRSLVTFDRWMELDMQYLDEWSFWLDIKILARTIPAVWKGSGAV
jgi:exopolysaccharide biosynthesis polyprenyl glycosylphosphotransferase